MLLTLASSLCRLAPRIVHCAAACQGFLEVVKLLLDRGADPGIAANNGCTAAMSAANNGHLEVVELFLDRGVDPNTVDDAGLTMALYASEGGETAVVELLLDRGADPEAADDYGDSAATVAAREDHVDLVELLLNRGVDPNARAGEDGSTALERAAENGSLGVAELLLDWGADPNAACDDTAWTPAIMAADSGCLHLRGGCLHMLTLLAIHGADMSVVVEDGNLSDLAQRPGEYDSEDGPRNRLAAASFLDITAGWLPFQIVAGYRTAPGSAGYQLDPVRLRDMLARGQIDTAGCSPLPECVDTMENRIARPVNRKPGTWAQCAGIVDPLAALVRQAMAKWSPSTHWLHHEQFREAVHTVLLVAERLVRLSEADSDASSPRSRSPMLPPDMWLAVLGQLLRRDWQVVRDWQVSNSIKPGNLEPVPLTSDPVNPCPICLDNEDDHGKCGMCYQCGQLLCGDCNSNVARTRECPTCRAPFIVPAQVDFRRLQKMLKERSPGRHTPYAQSEFGRMYHQGTGVAQNFAKAVKWFRLAAGQGDAQAQFGLGLIYQHGEGVTQNIEEAVKWWRLAAEQQDAEAQWNLAAMYATGQGVARDMVQAMHWCKLAADQGHPYALQKMQDR